MTQRVPAWEDFEVLQDQNFTLETFRNLLEGCKENAASSFRKRGWKNIEFKNFAFDTESDRDARDDYESNIRATLSLCFERDETDYEKEARIIRDAKQAEEEIKAKEERAIRNALNEKEIERIERETYERLKLKYEN